VYLPRIAGEAVVAQPAVTAAATAPLATSKTVLIAEDAEALRQMTRRMLQRHGYSVLVASNADEAVRLFRAHPTIDVLLTDVVMPGASGPELTMRLKEERPELKVVYMSGYTEDAIVQRGVLNHGVAFLHKPFTFEALGRKLQDVLAQS